MYGIDILYTEHEHVVRFTQYLRRLCGRMLEGEKPDKEVWMECVRFIRDYADEHHHGKEEAILFEVMLEKLGPVAEKMINTLMGDNIEARKKYIIDNANFNKVSNFEKDRK